jgi:hypothetical protein
VPTWCAVLLCPPILYSSCSLNKTALHGARVRPRGQDGESFMRDRERDREVPPSDTIFMRLCCWPCCTVQSSFPISNERKKDAMAGCDGRLTL